MPQTHDAVGVKHGCSAQQGGPALLPFHLINGNGQFATDARGYLVARQARDKPDDCLDQSRAGGGAG